VDCDKETLVTLLKTAQDIGEPHVNLSALGVPVTVSTNLYDTVVNHEEPQVRLEWNDSHLTVSKTDGGIMATFEIKF